MKKIAVVLAGVVCLSLAGCTSTEQGAGIGAVGGGTIGGVVGHSMGNTGAGIAVGAVGGALLGGMIGSQQDRKTQSQSGAPRTIVTCPNGHQVDVTGFPAGSDVRCPVCNTVFKI
jgi:outer membrane lipoprotein SlyB